MCFWGNVSAIIMCGAGIIRNVVSLYFAYKPHTKIYWKYIAGGVIVALVIAFNIVFWTSYYNIFSIVIGTFNVVTFMQSSAKRIRHFSVVSGVLAITYFSLLVAPINIIIETVALISAIIGIIRIDIMKKKKAVIANGTEQS